MDQVVGPIASQTISLETVIRVSTPTEKEHVQHQQFRDADAPPAGLTVRDGVGDDVARIVGAIKGLTAQLPAPAHIHTHTQQQPHGVGEADSASARLTTKVGDFRTLVGPPLEQSSLCDLTALSLAKRAVELGAFAIVMARDDDEPHHDEVVTKRNERRSETDAQSAKRQRTHTQAQEPLYELPN